MLQRICLTKETLAKQDIVRQRSELFYCDPDN